MRKQILSAFTLLVLLGVLFPFGISPQAANLTVNGSTVFQTMGGVGTNINSWSWKNGELQPALDMLIDDLGYNIIQGNP